MVWAVVQPMVVNAVPMLVLVLAAAGRRVVGMPVKRPLQDKHQEETGEHPEHRHVQIPAELDPGMGQEVQHAHTQQHAAGERHEHLHRAVPKRHKRHRRTAGERGRRDQHQRQGQTHGRGGVGNGASEEHGAHGGDPAANEP